MSYFFCKFSCKCSVLVLVILALALHVALHPPGPGPGPGADRREAARAGLAGRRQGLRGLLLGRGPLASLGGKVATGDAGTGAGIVVMFDSRRNVRSRVGRARSVAGRTLVKCVKFLRPFV